METLNNNQQTTGLQTFFNDGINAGIRMKMIDGESWFIAKDICCALGLQDVSMTVKRLDDDEKLIQTLLYQVKVEKHGLLMNPDYMA